MCCNMHMCIVQGKAASEAKLPYAANRTCPLCKCLVALKIVQFTAACQYSLAASNGTPKIAESESASALLVVTLLEPASTVS